MRRPIRFAARLAAGVAVGAVAAVAAGVLGAGVAQAAPAEGQIHGAGAPGAIKDAYIVVFKDSSSQARRVPAAAQELATRYGGSVHRSYAKAVPGFTAQISEAKARRLAADPAVAYVEQDRQMHIAGTQTNPPSWGLDRLDQRNLPLSKSYTYPSTASSVTSYVLDTGVRLTHTDFGGRARSGYDFVDNDADASDCQGHGTHVAGTIAGTSHGVAKAAKIVAVRVLDCAGSGSYSTIIAGIDWVTNNAVKPAVANMSLGGSTSTALDAAVRNSIASGVTYAVAAGNDNVDACTKSPAHTTEAITVAASDAADTRASFSNYGTCVDIFAPGVNILSSANSSNTGTATMSGTSMATPHVAGAAALVLAGTPTATPAQVAAALTSTATTGKIAGAGAGSPNRLLYSQNPSSQDAPGGLFAGWAAQPGVRVLAGDYNGDGKADVALTGGSGWNSIPVALSKGDGTFTVTNTTVADFPSWVSAARVQVVAGDINGDGKTDLIATGPTNWNTIPAALSNGNGTFTVVNRSATNFPGWASTTGARVLAGDYNGDGKTDLAITGPAGWNTIPLALSNGDGTFTVTNTTVADFPSWVSAAGVQVVTGDINGDGKTDLIATGPTNWNTIPAALSNGNGTFTVVNRSATNFPGWAATTGARVLAGDYNGDGKTDLAITGPAGWNTIPLALSNGDGTFTVTNTTVANFPSWATAAGVQVVTGDINGDSKTDLAITGASGWNTVPVAFAGASSFTVTNLPIS